eukprot:jgi/Hompol1/6868/HPOL_004182-RA
MLSAQFLPRLLAIVRVAAWPPSADHLDLLAIDSAKDPFFHPDLINDLTQDLIPDLTPDLLPRPLANNRDAELQYLAVIMQDLAHPFTQPCIADIKLGQRLYSDKASPEKRARMIEQANITTSGSTGLRFCGLKVFSCATQAYHNFSRLFGRSLTPESLIVGLRALFGLLVPTTSQVDSPDVLNPAAEPPSPAIIASIQSIRSKLSELHALMQTLPVRIYGGSVLIIYEGDPSSDQDPRIEVRLIDFANADFVDPEMGPDTGLLLGLANLIHLFDTMLAEIQRMVL